MRAIVVGVLLAVVGVVGVVGSQLGKKEPEVANDESPKENLPTPPAVPKPGDVSILKYGNPQVEMKFRWIPSGKFMRGDERIANTKPVRGITISNGFWMAETECTQAQWRAVMKERPEPSKWKGDNLPVEQVSALDADEFCVALGKLAGKPMRLPTEAEWEYACRAGTTTEYYIGDGEDALKKVGWYVGNSGTKMHPVGQMDANKWGLRDMHGNVWEWCQDDWDENFYKSSPDRDPVCKDVKSNSRVLRGGSFIDGASGLRSALRYGDGPMLRNVVVGLRLARTFTP